MRLLFVTMGPDFGPGLRSKWIMQGTIIKNLEGRRIECRRVVREEYLGNVVMRLPVLNMRKKRSFERLLGEFGPDAVILDIPTDLGPIAAGMGIPVLVYFWDLWMARKMAWESRMIRHSLFLAARARIMDSCLRNAAVILAETDPVSDVIRRHYPENRVATFPYSSIDTDYWSGENSGDAMDLRHPCVGLLQNSDWWIKAREMLVLPKVMEALPDVTFYWAGTGRHRDRVLAALSVHDNFEYLGELKHPDMVRRYLSSIDVYGLASGVEMSPYSLKQAMSLERPVIATDAAGMSETMRHGETGFLVGRGDHEGWVGRISQLLGDPEKAQGMGSAGRRFVRDNLDSRVAAERLVGILEGLKPK